MMNGLKRILEEITADSVSIAEQTLEHANAQTAQILRFAETKAEQLENAARERAAQLIKEHLAQAESTGNIRARRALLSERQRLVTETMQHVQEYLAAMEDTAYFSFLLRLLQKYASGTAGTLFLSQRDRARATPEFMQAAEEMGFSVAQSTCAIPGGFLLSYGEIEENCSFDVLFETEKDRLQDVICRVLFQEGEVQ